MPFPPLWRAEQLDSTRGFRRGPVRVPQWGASCAPRQVEFHSRLVESGSTGLPRERGARQPGAAFFGLPFLAAQER